MVNQSATYRVTCDSTPKGETWAVVTGRGKGEHTPKAETAAFIIAAVKAALGRQSTLSEHTTSSSAWNAPHEAVIAVLRDGWPATRAPEDWWRDVGE